MCQIVEVEVHVAFTVDVEEGDFAVWVEVCPAHVSVTVFVLVDAFPRLTTFNFPADVGQAVAEAVFVVDLVDHCVLVDVQEVYEVATVCVTVTVALTVTVIVVVLAGLVTVEVVVLVTVVGGGVVIALEVEGEVGVAEVRLELVLDGRVGAPQAPRGSILLLSSVTAAVSA